MTSAVAIGPAFGDAPHKPVGETIYRAVRDTRQLVRTNTNLGIILLLTPLAKAAGHAHPEGLRAGVHEVLETLSVEDARWAFDAIRLAAPAGLGQAGRYDVRETQVDITLREAMRLAQARDSVAREYVTDFEITFEIGYQTLRRLWAEGHPFSDAIVQTALVILSRVPDTLIARKEGLEAAQQVSCQAQHVLQAGGALTTPGKAALRQFDRAIRDDQHRLNPGTTADLTAAAVFVFLTAGGVLETFPDLLARW
jgi:triphosphoribosyl-dephospho-CoA synthase